MRSRRRSESATGAKKELLSAMVRKRWLAREAVADQRDARRVRRVAVLVEDVRLPRLNENQTAVLAELAAAGGRVPVRELQGRLEGVEAAGVDAGDAGAAGSGSDCGRGDGAGASAVWPQAGKLVGTRACVECGAGEGTRVRLWPRLGAIGFRRSCCGG